MPTRQRGLVNLKNIFLTILITACFCAPLYLLSEVLGPLPRKTGGNFPGEESCANSDCHGGAPNTGDGSVSISINGLPLHEYLYTPGETVPVAITVSDPGRVRWGFQLTARTNDGCGQAGNFTTTGGPILIQEDSNAAAPCPPATLQFPSHSFPAVGSGSATFMLNWTAPSADIGAILFAAAGNAANGNNEKTGDNIYTTQGTVVPNETGGEHRRLPSPAAARFSPPARPPCSKAFPGPSSASLEKNLLPRELW